MHDNRILVAAVAAAVMLTCAAADLIKVGGKSGWKPNVNYTNWAAHRHFYVGDWLLFGFDKKYYNVLEVTRSNYERCNDENFLTNITRGGRDVYNLTEAKAYYFLSSGGYCFEGMKLSIHVHRLPAPSGPESPDNKADDKNGAGPDRVHFLLLIMMAALSAFVFTLS